jgi:D-alanyl-D-alanine carboxypeptidase
MTVREAEGRDPRSWSDSAREAGSGSSVRPRPLATPRRPRHQPMARPVGLVRSRSRIGSLAPLTAVLLATAAVVVLGPWRAVAPAQQAGPSRSAPASLAAALADRSASDTRTAIPQVIGGAPRTPPSPPSSPSPVAPTVAAGPPPCTFADTPAPRSRYADWATTLVDTAFALPDDYVPPDLVPVGRAGIPGGGYVRSLVIDDLRALADAARDAGNPFAVQSAYRSRSRQAEVFAGWVASSGEADARRLSARPGQSEHQLGTVLDLRSATGGAPWSGHFETTVAGRWLARHAAEFGFVLSYPAGAEATTCYGAEAWHVRYVGRTIAAEVVASGLPLRAWLWQHRH